MLYSLFALFIALSPLILVYIASHDIDKTFGVRK